jgi:hypothetical protein
MTSTPPMKDEMLDFLRKQKAETAMDYVNRGRAFEKSDGEILKARWVEIVGEMAELNHANAVERDDIEAELTLRGVEPPAEAVDLERAMTNMVADLIRMRDEEPAKFKKMEQFVGAAALDFLLGRYGQLPH